MQTYRILYSLFRLARKAAWATGLAGPLRTLAGPVIGRLIFKTTPNIDRPMLVNNHKMFLATSGSYPPTAMILGRYEEETTRLFKEVINAGACVVDVGAHVGYYTLLAAKRAGPAGKVFAFEPDPANYSLLEKNISLNDYHNVVAMNEAVSNHEGISTLFRTSLDNGRHSTYNHGLPGNENIETKSTTMDAFLGQQGWPRVDLVKIDVEGAERDVLEGMGQLLQRTDPLKLIMEFNPLLLQRTGVDLDWFLDQPASWRFEVYWINDDKGLLALDEVDRTSLISKLLREEGSLNLYCTRE